MNDGKVSPDSVEKKARTLVQQTMDAVRAVVGPDAASVGHGTWQQCTTETPGQHRFEFTYTIELAVPQGRSSAVMDAAKDHFTEQGYALDPPEEGNTRVGATLPKSTWTVGLGVKDSSTTVIEADSDCVFTTHDPPTGGKSS